MVVDPLTLAGVGCIALTSLVVGLWAVWWMVKSAVRMVYKLVVFAFVATVLLAGVAAVAAVLIAR